MKDINLNQIAKQINNAILIYPFVEIFGNSAVQFFVNDLDKQIYHYLLGWLFEKNIEVYYFDPIFTDETQNAIDRLHHLDNDLFVQNNGGTYLIGYRRVKERIWFITYDTAIGMQIFLDYDSADLDGKKAFFKKLSPSK